MTIYYNPQKLRPRRWIIITFVCIPILVTVITYFLGRQKAEEQIKLKQQLEQQEERID